MEEPESSELAATALERDGVTVHTGARASAVSHDGDGFAVTLDDGHVTRASGCWSPPGAAPTSAGLGVDTVGLDPAAQVRSTVDERMRAGDGLWAVGDVTGHGAFTHMAMYQAGIAVRDILGQAGPPADYRALPRVTFTDPEIGVGRPDRERRRATQGIDVAVGLAQVPSSARGWIHKAGNEGFIKLVVDADARRARRRDLGRAGRRRGAFRARRGGPRARCRWTRCAT